MRNNLPMLLFGILLMSVGVILFISLIDSKTKKHMNHSRVEYLRDSLEMEYYKKRLELYPYNHSEIPADNK